MVESKIDIYIHKSTKLHLFSKGSIIYYKPLTFTIAKKIFKIRVKKLLKNFHQLLGIEKELLNFILIKRLLSIYIS